MSLAIITDNSQLIIAFFAALAMFSAVVVVGWPYLAGDELTNRMRQISSERERIRARERAKLESQKKQASLRVEPKKFFKDIVDRFNLTRQTEDGNTVRTLRMAGYRGQNPVFVFLSLRLIMPLAMFAISALYVFVILKLEQPFMLKLAIVLVLAFAGYYLPALWVKNQITKRQKSIRRAWPDALDLLLICVESGMGIEGAFRKVSEEIGSQSVPLAEELRLTTAELSYLQDRRKAYENLGERTGLEGVQGRGDRAHPGGEIRHADRHSAPRAGAGKPRHAHVGGREEGRGAAAQADRADDPVLPAGAVRGDHHAGDHPGYRRGRPQPLAAREISGRTARPPDRQFDRSDRRDMEGRRYAAAPWRIADRKRFSSARDPSRCSALPGGLGYERAE